MAALKAPQIAKKEGFWDHFNRVFRGHSEPHGAFESTNGSGGPRCSAREEGGPLGIATLCMPYDWCVTPRSKNCTAKIAAPRSRVGKAEASLCLRIGQSFCFEKVAEGIWEGLVGRRVFQIKEAPDSTLFRCVHDGEEALDDSKGPGAFDRQEAALRKFFRLDVPFAKMVQKEYSLQRQLKAFLVPWWRLRHRWGLPRGTGLRVLGIDPVECLFCFICSANNNIPRITLMVRRLRERFGLPLAKATPSRPSGDFLGNPHLTWHAFPSVASLAAASVEDLTQLGLGYRARLVNGSAIRLMELGGPSFLDRLRCQQQETQGPPYEGLRKAREALLEFPGVGRKVAECVALYGLGFSAAWPIDTHLMQHSMEDKDFHSFLVSSSEIHKTPEATAVLKHFRRNQLSPLLHDAIQQFNQRKYGPFAGWAQALLFIGAIRKSKVQQKARGSFGKPKKEPEPHVA
ncbi:N-glycosylase/DNA lyase-like [Cyclospora cayetanensis]|uniref:DNA-(apurinic or apyrimidinic site) lyase n=1 Tax=Cyclospora cayetanensis TaxID=88456 RepID=A0A6P6RPE1_9EIME|nr:N-glycosylase/DNA lyase-like [Cyclospora cayetanensis]